LKPAQFLQSSNSSGYTQKSISDKFVHFQLKLYLPTISKIQLSVRLALSLRCVNRRLGIELHHAVIIMINPEIGDASLLEHQMNMQ